MGRPRGAPAVEHDQIAGEGSDRVHLVVPASSRFLRTARLVAADAAGRAGCDVEEIEDFRIAVDELCHLLMTATDHFVHLTVTSFDTRVVARGSTRSRTTAPTALDEVSEMIVAGTVDRYEITASGTELSFEVVKSVRGMADGSGPPAEWTR